MKMKFFLALILLVLKLTQEGSGQCIQFQFVLEPPTESNLTCNPYDVKQNTSEWHLIISCDVRRISGTDQFDVHWFHKNNDNEITDLGRGEVIGETLDRELVTFGAQWMNTSFNESMLGEYWCQVIVTSTQPNIYHGRSNSLVVREPEFYNNSKSCEGNISVPTSRCADKNISSQIAATVSSEYLLSSSLPSFFFTRSSALFSLVPSSSIISSQASTSVISSVVKQSSDSKQYRTGTLAVMSLQSSITSSSTYQTSLSTSTSFFSSSSLTQFSSIPTSSSLLVNPSLPVTNTPSPSANLNQLESGDNAQLIIITSSIGGIVVLLILILLIIISVVIWIKNEWKNNGKSGNRNMYHMSSIRNSSRHLLSNSDLSLDPPVDDSTTLQSDYQQEVVIYAEPQNRPFQTDYQYASQQEVVYAEPQTPLLDHRYSIIRDSFSHNRIGHYSTQDNPWGGMQCPLPLPSDNYPDSSGVLSEYSYSSVKQPSSLTTQCVYTDEYSKLHTTHSTTRQEDESLLHEYHQLDHLMKQQPQSMQNYSKLDQIRKFGKIYNTLEESLRHDDHDSHQEYNQMDRSIKLDSQSTSDYSQLDRSDKFEMSLDQSTSTCHSDHDVNRPSNQEYSQLNHSMKFESQPIQDYKGKSKPMSLERSPWLPGNALEKLFDDAQYSPLGSISTNSKVMEHYEYSTDLRLQQNYTEMGGVEAVNNPKNALLPIPKGSSESKCSGNYERDPSYTPVIPKSKRRQVKN